MLLNEIIHELHVLLFPTKSAEHKQKIEKNDLLEIYTKERSNMSAFLCFDRKAGTTHLVLLARVWMVLAMRVKFLAAFSGGNSREKSNIYI